MHRLRFALRFALLSAGAAALPTVTRAQGSDETATRAAARFRELRADGTFTQNFATASTTGTINGSYTLRGNRLTLNPENRGPSSFTASVSADGNTLTLRGDDGSGYRLTR